MDPEEKKFGRGPRELTGAVDLLSHFKLQQHYDFFCKRSLPLSISDTHYLHHVVGDTEIRKGEGMQLAELIQDTSQSRDANSEKGEPTIPSKLKGESKDKEKKHKKHRERDSEKDREHKKHKHRHKDRSKDRDKDKKDRSAHPDSGLDHSKKHEKKRKHDGDENVNDIHRHKKSKHKSSKLDDIGAIKVAG
ncbi:mediator of RNA polymerase II transcription subunit 19a-like isoform X2 [Punica granatum]|uniref:Mediator of RNA polymerase II transcription subunit 19a-like isoform X2 n=1 Tax=Punica granatum TaxID=22663 RepID=A0A6P8EHP3_PUNGR|nr:mediator of RNA polymerase II transcription subunit 19a-like isoform X2 [Punica granatum]